MRSALLRFAIVLSLVAPGVAQMRSTISAGHTHGSPGHSPVIITRPGFGHHLHRNGFGTVLYPFGLYDGYNGYDEPYPEVVEKPAPVVIVRDEAPAAPAAPVQATPVEPKMIEVPALVAAPANPAARAPAAVFIFTDGRRLEAQSYTITDSILTIKEPRQPAMQIPLDRLNLDATLAENHRRGLDLQLPESRSEIFLGF